METASFIPRENEDTLRAENQLRGRIEKSWDIKMEKLPTTYSLDYAIKKGEEVKGFIELKCRTHVYGTFDTYMISLKKWKACREFQASSHLKAFLGVGFTDGDYWLDTANVTDFSVKMGGRSDRDWTVDREPCVFFNREYFKEFK
jgi:hypothetical protein